jgi:flavin reductase (DIM6/NTAB) family NADH-FMN oxidoreductase RutF
MPWFDESEFSTWERFYRANVLSSLSGYKPAMLVGTTNSEGMDNLALFQNLVHLGANPALIGLINRPEAATPHTLHNIKDTGCFTLNSIPKHLIAQAHQTSAKYADNEFDAVGIQPERHAGFMAPFVAESPVKTGLRLVEIIPIKHNNTYLIIGQVECFFIQEKMLTADGYIHLQHGELVCTTGLDGYALPTLFQRYAYAKPDQPAKPLPE